MEENHQVQTGESTQPIPPQPAAWERKPDEPSMWFERFDLYRAIGPARSIRSAYIAYLRTSDDHNELQEKATTTAPRAWYDNAIAYDWQDRAEAHDQYIYDQRWADEAQLRAHVRRKTVEASVALLTKAWQAIEAKQMEDLVKEGVSPLSQAIKTAARILHEEIDGYSSKTKLEVDIILKQLPPELQKLIQSALKPNK